MTSITALTPTSPPLSQVSIEGSSALHQACQTGDLAAVTRLLNEGAYINTADKQLNTPLHIASEAGNSSIVSLLIERGALVHPYNLARNCPLDIATGTAADLLEDQPPAPRWSLLQEACKQGKAEEVEKLLTQFSWPSKKGLIHIACEHGHEDVVNVLLVHGGISINEELDGKTPLHLVIEQRKCEMIRSLLTKNARVRTESQATPLHIACEGGDLDMVELLITLTSSVDAEDANGQTCMHAACKQQDPDIIQTLLRAPVSITIADHDEQLPIHIAAAHGHTNIVEALLDRSTDPLYVNMPDINGNSPLDLANEGGHESTKALLLERGAEELLQDSDIELSFVPPPPAPTAKSDSDADSSDGEREKTPLHSASYSGNVEECKKLLDARARINARDENGRTPLHLAFEMQKEEAVAFLVEQGASLELKDDKDGFTPLHVAAFMGELSILELLPVTDMNITDNIERTPLHLACLLGHTTVVRYLVQNGADTSAQDKFGKTPVNYAEDGSHPELISILKGKKQSNNGL